MSLLGILLCVSVTARCFGKTRGKVITLIIIGLAVLGIIIGLINGDL